MVGLTGYKMNVIYFHISEDNEIFNTMECRGKWNNNGMNGYSFVIDVSIERSKITAIKYLGVCGINEMKKKYHTVQTIQLYPYFKTSHSQSEQ